MILTSTVFDLSTRVTDRRTEGIAIAYARLAHMLSRVIMKFKTLNLTRLYENSIGGRIFRTDGTLRDFFELIGIRNIRTDITVFRTETDVYANRQR